MTYIPTDWTNNLPPYIDETNLNKIETGLTEAHTFVDAELIWLTMDETDTGTVLVNGQKIFADTSTAAFTLNLPATPVVNDRVTVADVAGTFNTNNLTLGANGNLIHGAGTDYILDINKAVVQLTYSGATYGWITTSKV